MYVKYLAIILFSVIVGTAYAATPFFANGGLTKNGIEWCEENYQLYQFMGNKFFEHHKHSIESRICVSLYHDKLWEYSDPDRYEKLIEQSRVYADLEIEESKKEAQTGIIDTKPAVIEEIPQEISQQKKELEETKEIEEKQSVINESEVQEIPTEQEHGGGCLIATAAYGSEMAPQVQLLREIRDQKIMTSDVGMSFMSGFNEVYYSFSPHVADYERQNPAFKELVRAAITPMVSTLSVMSLADSEQEVLGYGIGVVLMNLGMYIGIPIGMVYGVNRIRKARELNLLS